MDKAEIAADGARSFFNGGHYSQPGRLVLDQAEDRCWFKSLRTPQEFQVDQKCTRHYFGATLEVYRAPARSLVLYYWSSRAINHTRRPHGYDWHAGLVSLIALD